MPELRHLRYFIAVAEELNFSRAAERLSMAQPPLSVAIRQLEQEIGTALFHRSSREVRLTDAGDALLAGARRTLAEADAAVTAARRAGAGEIGRLHVAYNWSSRFRTLPVLGQAFSSRHPDVELTTEEMRPNRMPAALARARPMRRSPAIPRSPAGSPIGPSAANASSPRSRRAIRSRTSGRSSSMRCPTSSCSSRATWRPACTTSTSDSVAVPASSRATAATRPGHAGRSGRGRRRPSRSARSP